MEKKIKKNKTSSLRWSMASMLILGWLLPLTLIAVTLLYLVSSVISNQISKTILVSTDKAVEICEMQLGEILTASKTASYNTTIKDSYQQYLLDGKRYSFNNKVSAFLNQQYKYDRNFLCTMVFLLEEPEYIYYTWNTYQDNNSSNSGYDRVTNFKQHAMDDCLELSETLDTKTTLVTVDGHLYMVRNLVDSSFSPYGMIVIELSPSFVFESLNSVWGAVDYEIYVDGNPLLNHQWTGQEEVDLQAIREESRYHSGYQNDNGSAYAYRTVMEGRQEKIYLIRLDSKSLIDDVAMLRWILFAVSLFLIPLVVLIFRFFNKKVNRPVEGLVEASKEITAGRYGYLAQQVGDSEEFAYLYQSFNAMSIELQHQFEQIYLEELALRDANIMALQSQINPHFLNNTLEIINWEARLTGNEKVSGMIEALATMLNATMNRRKKRFIPLREELEYVNAYFYIISQRFGERFQVHNEVDSALLDVEIPLLIIQPIVENAVEHGSNGNRPVEVALRIYAEEDTMYIEVCNNRGLSPEDRERIDYLLGEEIEDKNERHVSLGIRNVDRRLKIIYGKECGLTIKSDKEDCTISVLTVKINKDGNKSQ